METRYQPHQFEQNIRDLWRDKFEADNKTDKPKFVLMMPPPNITGRLHMGHALNNTLQDSIARYKRMMGYEVLWLPGTDHASIATELKVVEQINKQGKTKLDLGRDEFVQECYRWKDEYGSKIVEQVKMLGCSVDWSRLAFTMDEQCSHAVKTVFVDLYNQGHIYQGSKIINLCCQCKTALSDAEVEFEQHDSFIYHIKYPIEGGGHIVVATTRPETMLGDVAVAVNPTDSRYKELVGKLILLPLVDKKIPIVADDFVEVEFGTGAVKLTPAHDPNDFEVGQRLGLDSIKVIAEDGTMTEGEYVGIDRLTARQIIVDKLIALGLLAKKQPYTNNIGHCYRCKTIIEPMLSKQWFVKMQALAEPAIEAVACGQVQFVPQSYTKIYMHWMKNIKDWCISRQLWWGHRIPAFYCTECNHVTVSVQMPRICPKCGGQVVQDDAVLDTWFSSALWPFGTLGYPNDTQDLQAFYPGSLLVTAYDIIFFWVARMIFSGIHHLKKPPFKKVLIHGIVRDEQGRKMSKSLGNGVDPIEIIEQYGTDSLRFCLVSGVALGSDIRYSTQRLLKAQAFANKLYNAARFVMSNIQGVELVSFDSITLAQLSYADKWILTKLSDTVASIHRNFDEHELGRVADNLYDFVWDEFCDWYIEISKTQIDNKQIAASVLHYVFDNILRILHPIMPFVTEYIFGSLNPNKILALSSFPQKIEAYTQDSKKFEDIKQLIVEIRAKRTDNGIAQNKRVDLYLLPIGDSQDILRASVATIQKLATVGKVEFAKPTQKSVQTNTQIATAFIILDSTSSQELAKKQQQELTLAKKELQLAQSKLNNQGFVAKAPQSLIQAEQEKLIKYSAIVKELEKEIDNK